MKKQLETDVLIIGGGIIGAAIARELSRYKLETVMVEKAGMISAGQTKASTGTIYGEGLMQLSSFIVKSVAAPGAPIYDPESQKLKFMREGFKMWPRLLNELDVPHKDEPTLLLATRKKELADLEYCIRLGESIGGNFADMRWVDKEEISALEPYVKNFVAGLHGKGQAIQTYPWELAIALSDNARQNGVRVILDAEVTGVSRKDSYQLVETTQGFIRTRFIVNAAGLFADVVADMAGGRDWELFMLRTCPIILDRRVGHCLNNMFITVPVPGRIAGFTSTLDGNLLFNIGKYVVTRDRYDFGCHRDEYIDNMRIAKRLIKKVSEKDIIRAFVGLRVFNTRDPEENIIEPAPDNSRFINVVVRPPGLAPMPAIARYVVQLLADAGLELVTDPDFNPFRKRIPRFRDLSADERNRLIAKDPRYGHVVCRCETITEGEIVEAIKRGAVTVSGIKYRTRAGMGRCQGGFCGSRVVNILARELGIPVNQVMDLGSDSPVVPYRSKELLRR